MTPEEEYKWLVCPIGKYPLKFVNDSLVCENCGTVYSIIEGIPNLIIDEAKLPVGINNINELKCMKERAAKT